MLTENGMINGMYMKLPNLYVKTKFTLINLFTLIEAVAYLEELTMNWMVVKSLALSDNTTSQYMVINFAKMLLKTRLWDKGTTYIFVFIYRLINRLYSLHDNTCKYRHYFACSDRVQWVLIISFAFAKINIQFTN